MVAVSVKTTSRTVIFSLNGIAQAVTLGVLMVLKVLLQLATVQVRSRSVIKNCFIVFRICYLLKIKPRTPFAVRFSYRLFAKIRHNSVLCQAGHSKSFAFLLLFPWFEGITYVFGGEKKAQIWRNRGKSEEVGIVVMPPLLPS